MRTTPTALEDITREDFERYEAVRASGVINMWLADTGCKLSGLDRATWLGIITHYSELNARWPDVRQGS